MFKSSTRILSMRVPVGILATSDQNRYLRHLHLKVYYLGHFLFKMCAKTGYQLWHARNIGVGSIAQSNGWSKLWNLDLPHKVKLFLWRFCRNTVPVRSRLSSKGVNLPLNCPMCNLMIEDLLHVFFICPFVVACWQYTGVSYDLSMEVSAPSWLLTKLGSFSCDELMNIAKVLWGIWFFRNQRVWEN